MDPTQRARGHGSCRQPDPRSISALTGPPTRREVSNRIRKKGTDTPAWFSAWNDLSTPLRHGIALALLLIVAVGFMAPDIFSGKQLVGGDIVHWKAMAQSLFEWEARTGRLPLWATGPFMGMPAYEISYALVVPQIDDVARILRNLFWPTSHLLILFGGMYGLVHYLSKDHFAAAFSAVAFGLSTYLPLLLIAGHHSKFVALALTPWLLWAFVHVRRQPGLLSGLLFAVATAASLRAGHVQITYYAAFTLGIWWLVDAVTALRTGQAKEFGRSTAFLALGGILGILMVAHPYLAKAEYKEFTIRGAASGAVEGGMAWDYAMAWSQGWLEMLTLLVANAMGGTGSTYWGPKVFTAGPHYLSGSVLLLAIYAVFVWRGRAARGLAVAALFMLAFSLGSNLEPLNRFMFNYFPLFDAFRVPETWLAMVALVAAVLAGLGLREVARRRPDREADAAVTRGVDRLCVAALVVTGLLMLLGTSMLQFERPGELESLARQVTQSRPDLSLEDPQTMDLLRQTIARVREDRRELFAADARRTFFVVLLASGLLYLARRRRIPGWMAQAGLVLLVALDLGGVGRRYFNEEALQPARIAESPVPEYGFDTYLNQVREESGGPGHFRMLSLEGDPTTTARPAYFNESLGGYHGAKLRRYQDFLEHILFDRSTGMPARNALAISNTRYLVAGGSIPGLAPVYSDQATGFTVFEVPYALPRGFLVDSLIVEPEAQAQWRILQSPSFDPGRQALVERDLGLDPVPDSTSGSVELLSYGPEQILWRVSTKAPRLFVASEVYYPAGWQATVDGEAAEIVPADYLLRGVVVPAGTHEVEMRFRPASHRLGLTISWIATLLVYGGITALLGLSWRRREPQT